MSEEKKSANRNTKSRCGNLLLNKKAANNEWCWERCSLTLARLLVFTAWGENKLGHNFRK